MKFENFDNGKEVKYYEYDLKDLMGDISDKDIEYLKKYALEKIKDDEKELINYAINSILRQSMEDINNDNTLLEKLISKDKKNKDNKDNKVEVVKKKGRGRPKKG